MGLRDIVRQAHGLVETVALADDHEDKQHPNWVLPRHDAWMSLPESERHWSEEAIQFSDAVHRGAFKHPRPGRISPSSMGSQCERELLFSYGGHPQEPFPRSNQEKMLAGEAHHLRWQMMGLTAGWMNSGEGWLHSEALRCGGSADGILSDGSLFELKSTAGHLFKGITQGKGSAANYGAAMHRKHKLQMEAYWLVDEAGSAERGEPRKLNDWGSLVYMDAGDPGSLFEYRIHSNPGRRRQVEAILQDLHDWIDLNQLPDMIDACWKVSGLSYAETGIHPVTTQQEQDIFNRCPYRVICPGATAVVVEEQQ